jgi:hypothetical protein
MTETQDLPKHSKRYKSPPIFSRSSEVSRGDNNEKKTFRGNHLVYNLSFVSPVPPLPVSVSRPHFMLTLWFWKLFITPKLQCQVNIRLLDTFEDPHEVIGLLFLEQIRSSTCPSLDQPTCEQFEGRNQVQSYLTCEVQIPIFHCRIWQAKVVQLSFNLPSLGLT